ncbi:MAG: ISAs1 family transposase [Anaerolineaceae bacterium]|nr:MAG: ISAs1 family transposase [Anaerolineaceae bacterium]
MTDTRQARGKIYSLSFILTIVLLAKLAGEDKPSAIAEWIRLRRVQLVTAFGCQRERVPCLNTIRTVLSDVISLAELQEQFNQYLHECYGGQQSQLVTIDGKTMRGTIPKGSQQGVHLLAAYLPEEGIVLAQVAVDNKENEISAAPKLIRQLDLRQRVVCGDAMLTQRDISVDVLAQGGDYLWFLKENQSTMKRDVEQFFKPPRKAAGWHPPALPKRTTKRVAKGHGRLETRQLICMDDLTGFLNWPGVEQVFQLKHTVVDCRTGETNQDVRYGITSLEADRCPAEQLLDLVQAYWGIENGLHYRRDVTLLEDATRIAKPRLAEAISIINNFVIGLTSKLGFSNLASARRYFDAEISLHLARLPDY